MSWVVGRGSWVEIVSSRCLGFDGFSGIVFIKSEILITTRVVSQAFLWLGGGYVRKCLGRDVPLGLSAHTRASSAEFCYPILD